MVTWAGSSQCLSWKFLKIFSKILIMLNCHQQSLEDLGGTSTAIKITWMTGTVLYLIIIIMMMIIKVIVIIIIIIIIISSSCLLRDLTCLVIKYINITWRKTMFLLMHNFFCFISYRGFAPVVDICNEVPHTL